MELGGQLDEVERTVLIPELYLAASLGKLSQAAFTRLEERYENFLRIEGWSNTDRPQLADTARRVAHEVLRPVDSPATKLDNR